MTYGTVIVISQVVIAALDYAFKKYGRPSRYDGSTETKNSCSTVSQSSIQGIDASENAMLVPFASNSGLPYSEGWFLGYSESYESLGQNILDAGERADEASTSH